MTTTAGQTETEEPDEDLESLIAFVRDERGFDFSEYKRSSLARRIRKRVDWLRLDGFAAYRERLEGDPQEFGELFNTILINVTSFFRDPDSWRTVDEEVIPAILAARDDTEPIRVWSAGCATGQEPYTIAMLLCDAMGDHEFRNRVKIYATDADTEVLGVARLGRYLRRDLDGQVAADVADRFFEPDGQEHCVFRKDLRRSIIFGRHDLMTDPPISRLDLLCCRNTLMYFTAEGQSRILRHLHFALRPDGFLLLGRSEALVTRTGLFVAHDLKRRVFRPKPGSRPARTLSVRPPQAREDAAVGHDDDDLRRAGFETSPVAQILLDPQGEIRAINQQARSSFGLTRADVGRPLQDLEISYRPLELRSRVETAARDRQVVVEHGVELIRPNGTRVFDIVLSPLSSSTGTADGIGIAFLDVTTLHAAQHELDHSRTALQTAYEELQSTVEELETTNEELQSTNEELETTNEELQSTNEELETMNEELQSTNEELETINDELRVRTDELNEVNSFLEAILTSLQSAVIVVDRDMRVTVWNQCAYDLWGLRDDEVIGEHFMNLDIGLPVERIHPSIRTVLGGEGTTEISFDAVNRRGRRVSCEVRAAALRRADDQVIGVILLMDAVENVVG